MKCSVYCGASVDGFIARPDGAIDWLLRPEYASASSFGLDYASFIATVDTLVMGRHTYEQALGFENWPYAVPVVVLSSTLTAVPEQLQGRVTLDFGEPAAIRQRLAQAGRQHLYIDGGRTLQGFLRAGCVDEITVTTLPLLLGAGISLFGSLGQEVPLRLLDVASTAQGFVQTRYAVVTAT